jgi:hypothetical protein
MWDIAFSKDPQQKYLYLRDGENEKVYIEYLHAGAPCIRQHTSAYSEPP